MKLKILTPEKLVLEKDVESVTLPGKAGQLTVLAGHDVLLTELAAGKLFFRYADSDGKPQREDHEVGDGMAEIVKDAVRVFVATAVKSV